jgi:uncharacterized protein YbjQ (UPF0145 family)
MGFAKSFGASLRQLRGANAIVAMRFDSSEIGQSLTEIVAYGTAVVVAPNDADHGR